MKSADSNTRGEQPQAAPAVSVVLPVYNGQRFLREALDSILAQTFADFELIVVDDCSDDDTPAILADYAEQDARLRIIRNGTNKKLPASLNIGFAQARAEWLTWTSDDNVLQPEALEALYAAQKVHPKADIIHADYRIIDSAGRSGRKVTTGPADDLLTANTIGCCFIYRRDVDARLGGYDANLFGVEDFDFWLRAFHAGFTFYHLDQELYHYRRHESSLSDQRARHIQTLVHDRLLPEAEQISDNRSRARARAMLATRDIYTFRPGHLVRAFLESPISVLQHARAIFTWLRLSAAVRIRGGVK